MSRARAHTSFGGAGGENIIALSKEAHDAIHHAGDERDTFLTIPRAAEVLNDLLDGITVTKDRMRTLADRKRLPFFKDMATGKRLIRKTDLIFFYTRQASHAARETTNAINKKAGL